MADFEQTKELGSGGFGKVVLCQNKISGKKVVIKMLKSNEDSLHRDIFINSLLYKTENMNKYSGVVRDNKSIHFSMPYLSGGTLTLYIEESTKQKKSLHETEIIKISYQILSQINIPHEKEIIHYDIKPDNIVFDGEGNAKLIDFGLAKCTGPWMRKGQLKDYRASSPGTIYYAAPELLNGEPYSNKIDIWSFGLVVIEMVTGRAQFYSLNLCNVMRQIKKYKFKPIVSISTELNNFISSCVTTDPDERPSGKQLMESKLIINYLSVHNKI